MVGPRRYPGTTLARQRISSARANQMQSMLFAGAHRLYAITAPTEIRTGKRKENKFNGRYTHLLPDGARFRIRTSDEPQDIQFDPERSAAYLLRYADLAGSSFATPEGAFEHFLKHGIGEGRVY